MVNSELSKRLVSGAALGVTFIIIPILGSLYLQILLTITLFTMLYEWYKNNTYVSPVLNNEPNKKTSTHVFSNLKKQITFKNIRLYIIGNIYIIIPMIYWLIHPSTNILIVLFTVWISDTFAYFGGKLLKGPKIAPQISPMKTWSGTICGMTMCILVYSIFSLESYISITTLITMLVCSFLGDLLESKVKRILKVKDSGNIIPGHGGILDRFDSFLLVSYAYIILSYF